MFRNISIVASSMAITFALVTGCVTQPDSASDPASAEPEAIYRTIVRLGPDGQLEQRTEAITVTEQQAEQTARAAYVEALRDGTRPSPQVILTDAGCAGADMWLFDQANLAGNELCLFRSGLDPLGDEREFGLICRSLGCLLTWNGAIRSLWAGSDRGFFFHCTPTLCFINPMLHTTPFQRINSVGTNPYNWIELLPP